MRIIRDLSACHEEFKGAVMALGNFDGVHLGHQAIFTHCVALARAERRPAAVMTFEPHPREFFSRDHAPMRIYPLRGKAMLIEECGIDALFVARFNKKLASTSAEDFIHHILHDSLRVQHVVTGYNFAFGKARQGNTAFMAQTAEKLGFGFTAHPPVLDAEGTTISSSGIRQLLLEGNVRKASAQLGRPYQISGRVRHGDKRGRTLGFPTANIALGRLLKPKFGIYAVRLAVGRSNTWHNGVASLGIRPNFPTDPLLEVHCFDVQRDLYGHRVRVELIEFIREEKKFADIEALKAQMAEDCAKAKSLLPRKGVA
jgi:riboflavin kinase / FMN adenylyltransferase